MGIVDRKYSEKRAAEKLGVSQRTLRRWRQAGKLPYIRAGQFIWYTDEHLQAFFRQNTHNLREYKIKVLNPVTLVPQSKSNEPVKRGLSKVTPNLKIRQVEAAIISLFNHRRDSPYQEDVCRSLGVTRNELSVYLKQSASTRGYNYIHWRQFRDQVVARHRLGQSTEVADGPDMEQAASNLQPAAIYSPISGRSFHRLNRHQTETVN